MPPTVLHQTIAPKRILIVEDDLLVAHTIRMALTVDHHTVSVAESGEQALAAFRLGKHDLVITDFKMGEMDGLELAAAIKQDSPTTPVILITAHADSIRSEMGSVSNVDYLLGKPLSVLDLHAAISKLFPTT